MIINKKEIFVLPTNTVYGIFAQQSDIFNQKRIFNIKERNTSKPLALYVNKLDLFFYLPTEYPNEIFHVANLLLPGPFLFVFKTNLISISKFCLNYENNISSFILDIDNNIGIRFDDNKILQKYISIYGNLVGTSWNLSEQKETSLTKKSFELWNYFKEKNLILDTDIFEQNNSLIELSPSTILYCRPDATDKTKLNILVKRN